MEMTRRRVSSVSKMTDSSSLPTTCCMFSNLNSMRCMLTNGFRVQVSSLRFHAAAFFSGLKIKAKPMPMTRAYAAKIYHADCQLLALLTTV